MIKLRIDDSGASKIWTPIWPEGLLRTIASSPRKRPSESKAMALTCVRRMISPSGIETVHGARLRRPRDLSS